MKPGDIYRHDRFYVDPETGELKAKYLVFLAPLRGGDWVVRLLTSRETWVDLRAAEDVDEVDAHALVAKGVLHPVADLAHPALMGSLECAAGAPDTTRMQEQAIRDTLARL